MITPSVVPLMAVLTGNRLFDALIWLCCGGLIFYLLFWLIGYLALPAPFDKIAKAILAIAAVIFLINVILMLAGGGFIKF